MIDIEWGTTYIINIPISYLNLVSGTFYTLDTDQFRRDLKALEASFSGMAEPRTHDHNTEFTVAGTTLARSIKIIPPYSVKFEDGQYSVQLTGSNNNIWSVGEGILFQNQVQVIPTNSAGLVVGNGGTGNCVWTETEKNTVITDVNETKAWARKSSDNAEQANNKLI